MRILFLRGQTTTDNPRALLIIVCLLFLCPPSLPCCCCCLRRQRRRINFASAVFLPPIFPPHSLFCSRLGAVSLVVLSSTPYRNDTIIFICLAKPRCRRCRLSPVESCQVQIKVEQTALFPFRYHRLRRQQSRIYNLHPQGAAHIYLFFGRVLQV